MDTPQQPQNQLQPQETQRHHLCSCTPAHCQRQQEATCAADLADIARQNQEAERHYRLITASPA